MWGGLEGGAVGRGLRLSWRGHRHLDLKCSSICDVFVWVWQVRPLCPSAPDIQAQRVGGWGQLVVAEVEEEVVVVVRPSTATTLSISVAATFTITTAIHTSFEVLALARLALT